MVLMYKDTLLCIQGLADGPEGCKGVVVARKAGVSCSINFSDSQDFTFNCLIALFRRVKEL